MKKSGLALGLAALVACGAACADITVGVTLSATGPAASLGIPEKNTHRHAWLADHRRPKGAFHRAGRQVRYDRGGQEHAQADQRGKGRCHRRIDGDAEFAGDARCRQRSRSSDDIDGRVGADRQSRRPENPVGVQDPAERLADGRCRRRAHACERRRRRWASSASPTRTGTVGLGRWCARRRSPASRSSPRKNTIATIRA